MRTMRPLAGALLVLAAMLPVAAADAPVARVPVPGENSNDPYVKEIFAAAQKRGEKPINLQLVMALAPEMAKSQRDAAYAIRFRLKVPRPYRELTILRTVQNWRGKYEFNQHIAMAKACGFSQAQIDAIKDWRKSALFDEKQRAVLAYVDELTTRPGKVGDRTFATLANYFPPNEIVELTLTSTRYMGTAAFSNAIELQVETDGRQAEIGSC